MSTRGQRIVNSACTTVLLVVQDELRCMLHCEELKTSPHFSVLVDAESFPLLIFESVFLKYSDDMLCVLAQGRMLLKMDVNKLDCMSQNKKKASKNLFTMTV